jgi:hypothetical protein
MAGANRHHAALDYDTIPRGSGGDCRFVGTAQRQDRILQRPGKSLPSIHNRPQFRVSRGSSCGAFRLIACHPITGGITGNQRGVFGIGPATIPATRIR